MSSSKTSVTTLRPNWLSERLSFTPSRFVMLVSMG